MAVFFAGILRRAYRDQQRLAALAVRDPLTALLNRRALLPHMNQWLSWSWRYERPVGVVLLDIDHFKQINDAYGHAGGDAALVAIAEAITETVRDSDVVGRFGGDEFVVLAPEADGDELDVLMSRLVNAVSAKALPVGGEEVRLSVSVGGAWVPGGTKVAPEILVAKADRSMYRAKEAGRNRAGEAVSAVPA
jgi:diguanylate cyclase (GGDEF)-like protein